MRRETQEELQTRTAAAMAQAPVGRMIRHVKSGGEYIIKGHALRESDLVDLVLYGPAFGPAVTFCRPLSELLARFVMSDGEQWPDK